MSPESLLLNIASATDSGWLCCSLSSAAPGAKEGVGPTLNRQQHRVEEALVQESIVCIVVEEVELSQKWAV
jgi:hypothetical protein